ncbi:MAG TPA: hypothetical protein VFP17_08450 [Solirubrobacterales bacterium]|nr:hypothetical protein [Solirubrobacterales bacterium]
MFELSGPKLLLWLSVVVAAVVLALASSWVSGDARARSGGANRGQSQSQAETQVQSGNKQEKDDVNSGLRVSPFALSILIGVLTIGLQVLLKLMSRQPPSNKSHGLIREDLVWWLDWVIAAVVAFMVLALNRADGHMALTTEQVFTLVFVFITGLTGIPTMVRNFGYDTAHDPPALRTGRGIVLPNLAGAVILLATVVAGAQLAG